MFHFKGPDKDKLLAGQVTETDLPNVDKFIKHTWDKYVSSYEYRRFSECLDYYNNNNREIRDKRRITFERVKGNTEPVPVENPLYSNHRISHALYKKAIKQKVGFVLSSLPILKPYDRDDEKFKMMQEDLVPYLNDKFHRTFKNSATYACVKGIDWVRVFWDDGDLNFERVPAEQVFPIWADIEQTILDGLIHCYTIEEFTNEGEKTIKHYDYYTKEFVVRYVDNNDTELEPYITDITSGFVNTYFGTDLDNYSIEAVEYFNQLGVPWVCLRYDENFEPLLYRVKDHIDEIDRATSEIADNISDLPKSTMVIKNYDGQDTAEFMQNLRTSGIIFVQGDGDADSLTLTLDINSVINYIDMVNSSFYENINGIDSSSKDTRDTSGVALSQLYRELSTEVKEWEIELRLSYRQLINYMLYDIYSNDPSKDYRDIRFNIEFVYDIIVNETEQIQNALTAKGIVSDHTIIDNFPWATDTEYEIRKLKEEEEARLDLELDYEREASSFGNDTTIETYTNLDGVRGSAE